MSTDRMPAGRCRGPLADVLDCGRCDSFSQPVIRWEHAVVAMPVLPRRWHEVGEPVEELKRREFDGAARKGELDDEPMVCQRIAWR